MSLSFDTAFEEAKMNIAQRFASVEEYFVRIAGERLRFIGKMPNDKAQRYLHSGDSFLDQQKDLIKIRKVLFATHNAIIKNLGDLEKGLADE